MLKWVMTDNLNSTTVTANADGTFNSELRYSAFGEIRYISGTTPTNYQYTGQLSQQAIGMDFYVARWYDPYLAHFVQADTAISDPGEPQTFDRYMYTGNNPILYNDPTGHDAGCNGMDCGDVQTYQASYESTTAYQDYLFDERWNNYNTAIDNAYSIVYWMPEDKAASLQQKQAGNNCAPVSIATVYNAFYGGNTNGNDLGNKIDSNWNWQRTYRWSPGGATLPYEQTNIINDYLGEDLHAEVARPTNSEKLTMINNLSNNNMLQMVTFYWANNPPTFYNNSNPSPKGGVWIPEGTWTGHTVILDAYDPTHRSNDGVLRPWGFISSWQNGGKNIFWVSDNDLNIYAVVNVYKKH